MPGKLQGPHNEFGQYLRDICILYDDISVSELARRAGISENTLLGNMAQGKPGPSIATLEKLWPALDELSKDAPLRESVPLVKAPFYNLAGHPAPAQQGEARLQLPVLAYFAELAKRNRELEARVQELEEENERLKMRRRPRP